MLRYQEETTAITAATGVTCPPNTATHHSRDAWRWTFSPFSSSCFLPVAKRNPSRLNRAEAAEEQCSCWGLSMHQTQKESILAFHAVERSFTRARRTLGTHVSTGFIDGTHGHSTSANHYGKFDLHPFSNAKFEATFKVIDVIPAAPRGALP